MCYYVTQPKVPSKSLTLGVPASNMKKVSLWNHPGLCMLLTMATRSLHLHSESVLPVAGSHPGYELPHGHRHVEPGLPFSEIGKFDLISIQMCSNLKGNAYLRGQWDDGWARARPSR